MSYKKIWARLLPLTIFLVLVIFLIYGLLHDPRVIPSPLQNKPVPAFQAQSLENSQESLSEKIFPGQVTILNVFATWCTACQLEHSVWLEARHDLTHTKIFGLNYKDQRNKVNLWLNQYGNPYDKIIFDPNGQVGINFGVYGTPETFIIDRQGFIRYKYIGVVSPTVWKNILLPEIKKWQIK